jgi:DMSO/TMAO reductase YedYZ molybdopterin-dependent catalytic subunit
MAGPSPACCAVIVSAGGSEPAPARETGTPVGRRVVLGMLGLGVAGILGGKTVANGFSVLAAHDPTGLTSLLPGVEGFRYYSIVASNPDVPRSRYQLQVGGLVTAPRAFSYAELLAMPQTHLTKDFQCVTGWRVPNVKWSGVALRDLLAAVGMQESAKAVLFSSMDGAYTESLTISQATRPDVIVATGMLGAPVTEEHGGPVRLYVAPMYGYKSIKWLGGIQVSDQVVPGYWEHYGYDVDAWIGSSNGRSDAPVD